MFRRFETLSSEPVLSDFRPKKRESETVKNLPRLLWRSVIQAIKKNRRRLNRALLRARWISSATKQSEAGSAPELGQGFERVAVLVINLDHRKDRLLTFRNQMKSLGIENWKRIAAKNGPESFPTNNPFFAGSIGCTLSHVEALQSIDWTRSDAAMICEDDAEFLLPRKELDTLINDFLSHPRLDVLTLYGRARGGSFAISTRLRLGVGVVGRVCYVVKPHMVGPLTDRFLLGLPRLKRGKRSGKGDRMWHSLQAKKYFFATPVSQAVRNSEGHSDIEGRMLGPR